MFLVLLAGHWLPQCPGVAGIAQVYLPLVLMSSISSFLNVILLSHLSFVIFISNSIGHSSWSCNVHVSSSCEQAGWVQTHTVSAESCVCLFLILMNNNQISGNF